jgi:uncharacterized protein YciI
MKTAWQYLMFLLALGTFPASAQSLFIVHLTTGTAWDASKAPNEQEGWPAHSENLARLRSEGKLVAGARYKDSAADKGMLIIRAADRKEVEAEFGRDPMIRDKRFAADIAPFQVFSPGYLGRPARNNETAHPLSKVAWFAGCWTGKRGKTSFREHWMTPEAGMMMGMARTISDGKVVDFESPRIETDGDGTLVYVPKPKGQAEVRFRLISADANRVVFENPANDFPTRIIYARTEQGDLNARIEGTREGPREGQKDQTSRSIDFPMQRASCE